MFFEATLQGNVDYVAALIIARNTVEAKQRCIISLNVMY